MKVFTIGNGFIASHFCYKQINERLEPKDSQIHSILKKYKPDVLINTIGFCGSPNIDQCEIEQERTILTNTTIPIILATECKKLDIKLVHIASGCIFCGESPHKDKYTKLDTGWRESDPANPASFYSKTKYAADLILGNMNNVAVLRIRMPLSYKPSPRNLISKLKNYSQVIDIPNSVTFVNDLVRCVDYFIKKDITGIYNVTSSEPLTAAAVMFEYGKHVRSHKFDIIGEKELEKLTLAKRSNCILDNSKLKSTGFKMGPSMGMLESTMEDYICNSKGKNVE
jgi:dTDP-4-dehydrorhamnose reductase